MVMACVYAILLWFHFRLHDQRKQITGCTHDHGKVISVDNQRGNSWALVWTCNGCPLQVQLRELHGLPGRDIFWYSRGSDKWQPAHLAAIEAARRLNRGLPGEHPDDPPQG